MWMHRKKKSIFVSLQGFPVTIQVLLGSANSDQGHLKEKTWTKLNLQVEDVDVTIVGRLPNCVPFKFAFSYKNLSNHAQRKVQGIFICYTPRIDLTSPCSRMQWCSSPSMEGSSQIFYSWAVANILILSCVMNMGNPIYWIGRRCT
jgi:hypothetical protein